MMILSYIKKEEKKQHSPKNKNTSAFLLSFILPRLLPIVENPQLTLR